MLDLIEKNECEIKQFDKNTNKIKGKSTWSNKKNNDFYNEIKADGLKKLASKAGLLHGCDVRLLKSRWIGSANILDVGSGFGRVIDALIADGFTGKITAVERSVEQYKALVEKFSHNEDILIINNDIYSLGSSPTRFDTIFMMWSGLADFTRDEQPQVIQLLAKLLNPNGSLIIDTMPVDVKPLDTEEFDRQSFLTKAERSVVHTYESNYSEICQYAFASGLSDVSLIKCPTDTKRERWLYIISQ